MMRFGAICIALAAVLIFQNERISTLANNLNPVCNTTDCKRLGKFYLENMDPVGLPCLDFYDYACSYWGFHNPRPKEFSIQELWSVDHTLELKALHEMRKLLERTVPSMSREFEQAKLLYRICTITPSMERSSAAAVWNVIAKTAVFPLLTPRNSAISNRPHIWEIDQLYIQAAGESALFEFNPVFDPISENEIVTELQPPPSAFGSLYCTSLWHFPVERQHYKSFLTKVVKGIAEPDHPTSAEVLDKDINDVIEFRLKFDEIIANHSEIGKEEIMTIKKFQSWYSRLAVAPPGGEDQWLSLIRAIYQNPKDPGNKLTITEKSKVQFNMNTFSKLATLLGQTNKRTIVNHIHLYFAERHLELTQQLKSDLAGSISISSSGHHAGIRITEPRWQKCIQRHEMKAVLGKAYVRSNFPLQQKEKLLHLLDKTKEAMQKHISQSTWLDDGTKQSSIKKLMQLKAIIGYEDRLDGVAPLTPVPSEMDPLIIEQTYVPELNRITFSAALLQFPKYSPHVPYVIDYGSVVPQFGHELHHAFDSDGITHNAQGKTPFWPAKMVGKYTQISKCFKDQYDKNKQRALGDVKLAYADTLDDDISDVMGLKVAYTGFKKILENSNDVCPTLPGFEKFSCEQLFFIAFANNYCSAPTPGYSALSSFKNGRNLPQIRVNSAVANMKEFSAAFKCRPTDTLNLKQTCDLWQH